VANDPALENPSEWEATSWSRLISEQSVYAPPAAHVSTTCRSARSNVRSVPSDEAPIEVATDDDEEEEPATEEAEAEEAGMSVVEGEDTDLEDLGDEEVEDEEDDTLLEEVEEDEDDVSNIIDPDIVKDER
jgi:hypothetical protein